MRLVNSVEHTALLVDKFLPRVSVPYHFAANRLSALASEIRDTTRGPKERVVEPSGRVMTFGGFIGPTCGRVT